MGPLGALEAEWRVLAARSDNVFATYEWCATWWRHFGRDRPLHCVAVRDDGGAAVAILPLYRSARRPVRVMRFLGHGPSDQLGPVCAPEDRERAAAALGKAFESGVLDADLLIADELPASGAWRSIAGATRVARSASPVADLGADAPCSTSLAAQLRRKYRRLARRGHVTFRCTRDAHELDEDLDTLFALHDARWNGESRAFAGRTAFHRDFAARAQREGWLRLRFLEVDGRPVAALYNLRFAGAESNYQAGRDPSFAAESVGLLLHAHALAAARAEGATEYRFLRGDEGYKSRFADADAGLETYALASGAAARALMFSLRPVPSLPRPLRRRVPSAYAWGTGGSPIWGSP